MKVNKWTTALASAGVIGGALAVQAEESPVMTALSSTTISGYVDTSLQWDLGTGNGNPPAYGFNDNRSDGFNLNAVNLQIGKAMDEGQWAAGYNVELLFGPNASAYNPSYNGSPVNDLAIKQAYVELRAPVGNGLDFKVGVFDTIIGYEVANSVGNPNFTRSWGWTIEPTQHTGVLMSYQFNDMFSATAGVANTLTPGINTRAHYTGTGSGTIPTSITQGTKSETQKTWMGSVAVTAPESMGWFSGSTLYAGVVYGFAGSANFANAAIAGLSNQNQVNYYVGGTMTTPWEQLTLGVAWDYAGASGNTTASPGFTAATSSYFQNVFGLYASYQATEKMSIHARGEYAVGDLLYTEANGDNGKIFSATGTVEYELWANVITRAEFRWDNGNDPYFGGRAPWSGGTTANTPSKQNAYTAILNIAYLF